MPDTKCQGCVFQEGTTKCKLGLISRAKNAGLEVVECWNEEGEFNAIKGRQCMFKRPQEWIDQFKDKPDFVPVIKAEEEVSIDFSAIVVMGEESTREDILTTVNSLQNQSHVPDFVGIVREFRNKVDPKSFWKEMKATNLNEWKIQNITDDRVERNAVELLLRFKPRPYFACFRAGRVVHNNFFWNLNHEITKEWFQFGIIKNDEDRIDGVVVSNVIYNYFHRQFDKLEELIEQEVGSCQGILNIQEVEVLAFP